MKNLSPSERQLQEEKFKNQQTEVEAEIQREYEKKMERLKQLQKLAQKERLRNETLRQIQLQELAQKERERNERMLNLLYEQPEYVVKQFFQQKDQEMNYIDNQLEQKRQWN